MITRLDDAALPLVLDFRHRMLVEAGGSHLLADDWQELTRDYYAEGYGTDTCAHFGWQEDGRIVHRRGRDPRRLSLLHLQNQAIWLDHGRVCVA